LLYPLFTARIYVLLRFTCRGLIRDVFLVARKKIIKFIKLQIIQALVTQPLPAICQTRYTISTSASHLIFSGIMKYSSTCILGYAAANPRKMDIEIKYV